MNNIEYRITRMSTNTIPYYTDHQYSIESIYNYCYPLFKMNYNIILFNMIYY